MMRRLPSLKALRAFEAAGRLGSFTAAARELGVTTGAISRQIKSLEDHFQVSLLERNQSDASLTPESRSYLSLITEVFRELEIQTEQLQDPQQQQPLNLLCSMTFANRWLVPKLSLLVQQYPEMDVHLTLSRLRNTPGSHGDVDIAIQHGPSIAPGFDSLLFLPSVLIPVCSPALLPITSTTMLLQQRLLMSDALEQNWDIWLRANELQTPTHSRRLELAVDALVYQAAEAGLGITIADRCLVQDALDAGSLVCPLDRPVATGDGWHVVYRSDIASHPSIERMRDWLMSFSTAV